MLNTFDVTSMFIFIIIGLLGGVLIKKANVSYNNNMKIKYVNIYYILFFLLFVFLAVFRKVDEDIGGADALNYINIFEQCLNEKSMYYYYVEESFFMLYCKIIRHLTDNYHVFFFVSYGLIISSIWIFIKKYCPKNIVYTPFLLLIWPYLKNFNTLRTGLAISVFLLGLVFIEDKKILSMLLILSTFFIHRMSVIYIPLFVFYHLYKKKILYLKGRKLVMFYTLYIVLSYFVAVFMQRYMKNFLDGKDLSYISSSEGQNIFSRWPMFFAQLCLLIALFIFNKSIAHSDKINTLKIFFVYDILMVPASLVLGIWRANEFLYVVRLILWGEIIRVIIQNFILFNKKDMRALPELIKNFFPVKYRGIHCIKRMGRSYYVIKFKYIKLVLVKLLSASIFIIWLIFRSFQEYEELRIMPYIFSL